METTFKHKDKKRTITITLRRSILDDARYLAMADNLAEAEAPQLANLRASFLMLAANTKSVKGLDWQPPTLQECSDPKRVQASFEAWMAEVDRDLLLHWQEEVAAFNAPFDTDEELETDEAAQGKN
jgi:hypothetical protein